jgi:Cdc6-like AAA superfamily ATPase
MEIIRGKVPHSYKIVIYGVPGIGKSTLAAKASKPLFLDLEGGVSRIDADKTPRLETWESILEAMRFAFQSKDYDTIIVDTLDALEEIIRKHVCKQNNWKSIEQAGYGKGYIVMLETLQSFLDMCDKMNKNVILIGHEQIKSFASPDSDSYDRYFLKMHQKLAGVVVARADAVLFAQYETMVKSDKSSESRLRAVGTGKRVLRTQETPAYIAKNRFNLDPTIEMNPTVFEKLI